MNRPILIRFAVASGVAALIALPTAAAAQECPTFTGESVRWKDPVTGICNAPKLPTVPKLRRGSTIRLTVVRNGIDFTDTNALSGVTFVQKGNTGGIGFITVDVNLTNAALGMRNIVFPHFTGGYTQLVQVVRRGMINSFSQSPNPATWGQNVTVTVGGNDLDDATAKVFGHTLVSADNPDPNRIVYVVRGNTTTPAQGQVLAQQWQSSLGTSPGVFYSPYAGSSLKLYLQYSVAPSSGTIARTVGATTTVTAAPTSPPADLVAGTGTPLLRHLSPIRKLANSFCNSMFAQAVNSIVRTITVPDLTFTISNAGGTRADNFDVQLRHNGAVVMTQRIASLLPGQSMTLTYRRPQSQTEVARLGLVPPALTRQTYNATGGECVQTIGQAAGFEWQDGQYEVRVDANNVVVENTKGNNNRIF